MNIDWDKAPAAMDCLVQDGGEVYWYNLSATFCGRMVVIATRPKPKLTDEQIELLTEFIDEMGFDRNQLEMFMKQRGGEHE